VGPDDFCAMLAGVRDARLKHLSPTALAATSIVGGHASKAPNRAFDMIQFLFERLDSWMIRQRLRMNRRDADDFTVGGFSPKVSR